MEWDCTACGLLLRCLDGDPWALDDEHLRTCSGGKGPFVLPAMTAPHTAQAPALNLPATDVNSGELTDQVMDSQLQSQGKQRDSLSAINVVNLS